MEKDILGSLLLDFYGNMLTERQKEVMNLYVDCDTGLSEIASIVGSSRQAVYEMIKVSEKTLGELESKLGCVKKYLENRNNLIECKQLLEQFLEKNNNKEIESVLEKVQKVLDNQ